MIAVNPNASFEASVIFDSALLGDVGVLITDGQGATTLARSTTGIVEKVIGSTGLSVYTKTFVAAPADAGQYSLIWDDGADGGASDDLLVTGDAVADVVPSEPVEGGPTLGPCTSWVTAQEVADCRGDTTSSDVSIYDDAAVMASQLLFFVSGRQFTGVCQRTVRPCADGCLHWLAAYPGPPYPVWEGHGWTGFGGCPPLSKVKLPGYPVREIVQVKIDGDEVDPSGYRLDGWRWLVRMADSNRVARFWPGCSRLDLDDDEAGTFAVTYLHGIDPPPLGVQAAARLASEIYDACGGSSDCSLPDNVVEVVRQGLDREEACSLPRWRSVRVLPGSSPSTSSWPVRTRHSWCGGPPCGRLTARSSRGRSGRDRRRRTVRRLRPAARRSRIVAGRGRAGRPCPAVCRRGPGRVRL
jgi:hypothetical protein